MTGVEDELRELAADLRAAVEDLLARGVREEGLDEGLEEVVAAPASVVAAPAPVPMEAAVTPTPAPAPQWGAIAAAARARADDGEGEAGLARIRADLGDCQRCKLCNGRTQIVFGVGDGTADLMVIGEGPGQQEDEQGEPFVGPAGQMLDKMLLNVIGLARSQVYIANVVKCRPPGNRDPEPDEVAACKPFLERQIEAVQPKVILVLGRIALEHVLGLKGIKKARGTEVRYLGRIPAIPTFHPAYLLRVPEDKRLTFEDLKLVKRRYEELGGKFAGKRT
jgi:uracil-DNA glycosylase family 4